MVRAGILVPVTVASCNPVLLAAKSAGVPAHRDHWPPGPTLVLSSNKILSVVLTAVLTGIPEIGRCGIPTPLEKMM